MNKLSFLLASLLFTNISFAEDIYVVSNTNYCVLTPTETPSRTYLNNLNNVKNWSSYQGSKQVSKNIRLNKFDFNLDVCPDTIFINEKDQEKYQGVDLFTNKQTLSDSSNIVEVTDKNTLEDTKKVIQKYIKKQSSQSFNKIEQFKLLSGFKYQQQSYYLVEATSSVEFEEPTKKGEFSFVALVNVDNKNIIPIETWFVNQTKESMRIINKIDGYIDIDNDGEYELVVRSSYYEGSSSILYKIVNNKAVQKRSCTCGL